MRRRAAPTVVSRSEDCLKDIEAIVLRLDSDRRVEFDLVDELDVPEDWRDARDESLRAHKRFVFWAIQSERALDSVRKQEAAVAREEAKANLVWRNYYENHSTEIATNDMIRSRVDLEPAVVTERIRLTSLRKTYGIVRAVRDAHELRARLLQRFAHDATSG